MKKIQSEKVWQDIGKMLSSFSSIGLIGNRRLTDTEKGYGMMILLLGLALACQPQRQKEVASFVLHLHRLPAHIFTLTEFNSLHLFSFLVLLDNILNANIYSRTYLTECSASADIPIKKKSEKWAKGYLQEENAVLA